MDIFLSGFKVLFKFTVILFSVLSFGCKYAEVVAILCGGGDVRLLVCVSGAALSFVFQEYVFYKLLYYRNKYSPACCM